MYTPGPSDAELEAIGITRADVINTTITEIFIDNWLPYKVFSFLCTQWRVGFGGPTGLDYSSIPVALDLFGVKKNGDKRDLMWAVQVMEREALRLMNQKD